MAASGGLQHDPGMDPLTYLPAITSFVLIPVGLGLAFRRLAGDPADDAIPTTSALLMRRAWTPSERQLPDGDVIRWRFDLPSEALSGPVVQRLELGLGPSA
jgi:hypothetical protein